MQTFLPYADFTQSADALDVKRLGKQRVEAWQILRTLRGESKGWANHPAVKMWRGHEMALVEYGLEMCLRWRRLNYKDTLLLKFMGALDELMDEGQPYTYPTWLSDETVFASHRSNLLRKDHDHYAQFGWTEPNDLPYCWPV